MGLTRPRHDQLITGTSTISDPITVLHGGSTSANVDVGFLINRANGLVSNVALYWNESGNAFVTAFTSNTGITDSNIAISYYAPLITGNLTATNLTATGILSDGKGDVRSAPQNSQGGAYTLVVGDAGKHISITTGGVTVNASIFSIGDMITIFNNSGSSQNITQGTSVTLRLAGTATTGTKALAQYGVATLLCVTGGATPVFACTGAGLT